MDREQLMALDNMSLSAAVHEKVMGRPLGDKVTNVRMYSENIAAAWAVVEKMRERGRKVSIETCITGRTVHNDVVVSASLEDVEKYGKDWRKGVGECDHPSMPRAVCVAALLAIGDTA